jgi:hypothetical protein
MVDGGWRRMKEIRELSRRTVERGMMVRRMV